MINHPFQLRRIELKDFKSVDHQAVDLRPLTVVIGANSAGKSTLLQSILAVTQAVRSGAGSTEFPLNGELVGLGTFDETRNFRSRRPEGTPMELAFDLVDASGSIPGVEASGEESVDQLKWRAYVIGPEGADSDGAETSGFAHLSSLQIEVCEMSSANSDDGSTILTCDISSFDDGGEPIDGVPVVTRRMPLVRGKGSIVAASGRVSDRRNMMTTSVDAVVLAGGVPQLLLRRAGQFERLAELWWSTAFEAVQEFVTEERRRVAAESGGGLPARPSVLAVDRAKLDFEELRFASRGADAHADAVTGDLFRRWLALDDEERRELAASLVELGETQFRTRLRERFGDAEWLDADVLVEHSGAAGDALWRASYISRQFFLNSVEYLGPIRQPPHVMHPRGPSTSKLGTMGEYTAAVLHAQRNTRVVMPTPAGPSERVPLGEALNFWLQQFGLADEARAEDRARVGFSLNITPRGTQHAVDLTAVGVGVSQILPVLLLCLLAEPGSLVLIEQPELHLHPKLQQDLADFLLACARSGRQLVIETHSQHVVNRLRYRIAEDGTSATHELIQLVFAENEDGITTYRNPEINPYGGLGDDWPAGFLDLTVRESQELVRESLAKRLRDEAVERER